MNFLAHVEQGKLAFENPFLKARFASWATKNEGAVVRIEPIKKKALRTSQQNRALHKYFEMLADALNEGGFTVQLVLKQKMELDWTKDMVKDVLWRTAQKAILKKESTKDLNKQEDIDRVYDHLNRHLSEKFGVHVAFPSAEPGYADTAPLKKDYQKKYE